MAGTIIKGEEHFFTNIYEGNGGGQRVGKFVPFTDNGTIAKSCIFNDDDTPRLYRQISAGNRKTYTISLWFKLGKSPSTDGAAFWSTSPSNDSGYGGNPSPYNLAFLQFVSGAIEIQDYEVSGNHYIMRKRTNRTFEDTSKWYHFLMAVDTTQSTESDRMKMYIDGDQITSFNDLNSSFGYPDQDEDTGANKDTNYDVINIGYNQHWDGYMAEFNFVDGTAYTPSTFGLTDTSTGRWIPKTLTGISYGTNGYRLTFANSAGQTIGDDTSGNTNDFTVTNLAASDITTDSPTQHHNTVDPSVNPGSDTISEGNLKTAGGSSTYSYTVGTMRPKKGKYYAEFKVTSGGGNATQIGIAGRYSSGSTNHLGYNPTTYSYYFNGGIYLGLSTNSATSWGSSYTDNDYVGVALDLDNNKLYFAKNNTWQNSSDPETGANAIGIIPPEDTQFGGYAFAVGNFEGAGGPTVEHNYGQKAFQYTPPSGYVAMQQDNLPETGKGIPDLMQIKNRDAADRWLWQDTTRGFGEYGSSASASPGSPVQFNSTITDGVQKSLKGGFQTEDSDYSNSVNESYVSFNWVANNGVTATDSSGNMDCELQANPTAGFSIAKFTVNGTGVRTWAHGLGAVPEFGHLWTYNTTTYGTFYHHKMSATPAQNYLLMSSSQAIASFTNGWGTAGPSSTLWSGTEGQLFSNGVPYMFYSYVGIPGYSKFDSYVGNGNADGPFVYLGFKPRYIWIKNTSATSNYVFDTVRFPNNPNGENVVYDGAYSEASTGNESLDFLSNGFKIRTTSSGTNTSGTTYIYGAFAEHPFNGNGEGAFATAR